MEVYTYYDLWVYSELIFILHFFIASVFIQFLRAEGKWWTFGIRFDKWFVKDFTIAFVLIVLFLAFIYLLHFILGGELSYEFYTPYIFTNVYIFSLFFIPVLVEELLFRGIIFQAIYEHFGTFISVTAVSLLFALAHIGNPDYSVLAFINTFLASVLLSMMYIRTRSLWLPIFFHLLWNKSISYFLGSDVSGHVSWTFVNLHLEQFPVWLFGGSYGVEGGIVTTIALLLFLPIVFKWSSVSPIMASRLSKMKNAEALILNKS